MDQEKDILQDMPEPGDEVTVPENEPTEEETAPENEPAESAEDAETAPDQEKPETGRKRWGRKKKKEKVKKTVGQEILSWVITILAALVIAFVIRTFVFEFVKVDGESMDDTLANHEIMFVSKLNYGSRWLVMPWANAQTQENSAKWTYFGNPQRFDVVICRFPGRGGTNFVKRVVGLPGDTVEVIDGYLYVNGEKYDEPYINDGYRFETSGANSDPLNEINLDDYFKDNKKVMLSGLLLKKGSDNALAVMATGYLSLAYENDSLTINGTAAEFDSKTEKLCFLGRGFTPITVPDGETVTVPDSYGFLLVRGDKKHTLIAHPGDTVASADGVLTVNGKAIDTAGCVLVMGVLQDTPAVTVPKKGDVIKYSADSGLTVNGNPYSYDVSSIVANGEGCTLSITERGNSYELKLTVEEEGKVKEYTNASSVWYCEGKIAEEDPMEGKTITIQSDYYLVMGDHRNNSNDGRAVGALERSYIIGKVKQVIWPLGNWRGIPNGLDVKAD